jgi:hypothetical protein
LTRTNGRSLRKMRNLTRRRKRRRKALSDRLWLCSYLPCLNLNLIEYGVCLKIKFEIICNCFFDLKI